MKTIQYALISLIVIFLFFGILIMYVANQGQAELNKMRSEHDISSEEEFVHGAAMFMAGMLGFGLFGIALILIPISLTLGFGDEEDEDVGNNPRRPLADNAKITSDVARMKKGSEDQQI